ncbi:unnamed protein product [Lathyrus oleraceus]
MEASSPSTVWWDKWVQEALTTLDSLKVLRSLRLISLWSQKVPVDHDAFEVFDEMQQWDRSSVEVKIGETTFREWMNDTPSSGEAIVYGTVASDDEPWVSP